MKLRRRALYRSLAGLAGVLLVTVSLFGEPPKPEKSESNDKPDSKKRLPVALARERAKLVHNIYATTLGVMHHRYFRNERSIIPARAMEDVFSSIAREEQITARWIAVNAKVMSINHAPRDNFEKEAAKAIAAGKGSFERIEDGMLRRAQAIPLSAGCVSCHGEFGAPPRTGRFAGLVINLPVKEE